MADGGLAFSSSKCAQAKHGFGQTKNVHLVAFSNSGDMFLLDSLNVRMTVYLSPGATLL